MEKLIIKYENLLEENTKRLSKIKDDDSIYIEESMIYIENIIFIGLLNELNELKNGKKINI